MTKLMEITLIWQHFQKLVLTLQQPFSEKLSLTPLQITQLYGAIDTYFQHQIMAAPECPLPPAIAGKMRSYTTEIHRLLKLIQRDLIFWQSASQPATKAQRQTDVWSKLDLVMQFVRSMIEELDNC